MFFLYSRSLIRKEEYSYLSSEMNFYFIFSPSYSFRRA